MPDDALQLALGRIGWSKPTQAAPPLDELLAEAARREPDQPRHMDVRALFTNLNHTVIQEVFTPEELRELEGEDTHVFTQDDMKSLVEERARKDGRAARTRQPAPPDAEAREAEAAALSEPVFTERDFRPVRRRRSYRSGLKGGFLYFGFVVCVSILLASVGWLAADDVLSLNKPLKEAQVFVDEAIDLDQVATELYSKGIIRYRRLFTIFAKLMKAQDKLDPGTYTVSTKQDYQALIRSMQQSSGWVGEERTTVKVLIPEGKTVKQTCQILAEHGVCPYETLLECAASYEFDYDFLQGIPYGEPTRLEGYLFPDTYEFYADAEPEDVFQKFLNNFDGKYTADLRNETQQSGYTMHEILTIASLIEMEAGSDAERATIASVIYNRLQSTYYPCLQIDATIQYILEERKESLSEADLQINNPYNTYVYEGLPPGPIANPGLASIRAALNPESTGYYFYALDKSGEHAFFSSYSQFEQFTNSSSFGG